MKRFYIMIVVVAITMIVLSSCRYKSWQGKRPCDQPNSEWMSENKSITFFIDKNGAGTGKIVNDNEVIDIHIGIGPATEIEIFPLGNVVDNVVTGRSIEYWTGSFIQQEEFVATVKKTTYFKVGDKITFYRVDK